MFFNVYKYIYLHFLVLKLIDSHRVMQVENKKNHVLLYLENVSSDHCLFDFHKGCKQHIIDEPTVWYIMFMSEMGGVGIPDFFHPDHRDILEN